MLSVSLSDVIALRSGGRNDYQSNKVQIDRSLLDRDHRISILFLVQEISCVVRVPRPAQPIGRDANAIGQH